MDVRQQEPERPEVCSMITGPHNRRQLVWYQSFGKIQSEILISYSPLPSRIISARQFGFKFTLESENHRK